MPKSHIENAPRFDTLLRERLHYLWRATYYGGKLPVDLKRKPPSNRGIIPQMIAQGLFEKKRGSSLALTDKGRAYMKRYGEAEYKPVAGANLSRLDAEEIELRNILRIVLLFNDSFVSTKNLGPETQCLIDESYFNFVTYDYGHYKRTRFRPLPKTVSIVAGTSDKRIRALIDKSEDVALRREYSGFSDLQALVQAQARQQDEVR